MAVGAGVPVAVGDAGGVAVAVLGDAVPGRGVLVGVAVGGGAPRGRHDSSSANPARAALPIKKRRRLKRWRSSSLIFGSVFPSDSP